MKRERFQLAVVIRLTNGGGGSRDCKKKVNKNVHFHPSGHFYCRAFQITKLDLLLINSPASQIEVNAM